MLRQIDWKGEECTYGINWKTNMEYDFMLWWMVNFFYEIFDLEYTDANKSWNKICIEAVLRK